MKLFISTPGLSKQFSPEIMESCYVSLNQAYEIACDSMKKASTGKPIALYATQYLMYVLTLKLPHIME